MAFATSLAYPIFRSMQKERLVESHLSFLAPYYLLRVKLAPHSSHVSHQTKNLAQETQHVYKRKTQTLFSYLSLIS
jgi:hypothetical protein